MTEQLGDTEAVDRMFVPQTLSSLGCPQVLQTMAPSELLEVNGREVHVVTVRSWNDGKQDDEEITVQLPARLTQKGKVMAVNTLVIFYGISTFVRDGVDMTYYQITCLHGEPDSRKGDVELQAAGLSILTQDQLREKVGIITLGDLGEGALFTVISTSPYMVGEGERMREDILARVVRARKQGQETYKEEDLILPGRFLPLLKPERLPIIGRYSGMRQTKCGNKSYYDVQFMRTSDKRLQNVSMMR